VRTERKKIRIIKLIEAPVKAMKTRH